MNHLFNRIYLEPSENISTHMDKVVIGRDNDFDFVDFHSDNLGKHLGGEGFPTTLYYAQLADQFVTDYFPTHIETLNGIENPIRFYVDDEARVRILLTWWKALFPSLTLDDVKELLAINMLDRMGNDLMMREENKFYQSRHVERTWEKTHVDARLVEFMRSRWTQLSLEYRLVPATKGIELPAVADTIRKFTLEALDNIVGQARQSIIQMFYTKKMSDLLGSGSSIKPLGLHPLTSIGTLEQLHLMAPPSLSGAIRDDPEAVLSLIQHDLNVLSGASFPLDTPYFLSILTEDDDKVVMAYLDKLNQSTHLFTLMPREMHNRLSINTIAYLRRRDEEGRPLTTVMG